jgi:hypothetical protein
MVLTDEERLAVLARARRRLVRPRCFFVKANASARLKQKKITQLTRSVKVEVMPGKCIHSLPIPVPVLYYKVKKSHPSQVKL